MKINKKGLTLVEVITVLAISGVVLAAIAIAIQSFSGQFKNAMLHINAKRTATLASEAIESTIRYARKGLISVSDDALGYSMITNHDGRLYVVPLTTPASPEAALLEERHYNKLNCNTIFSRKDDNTFHIKVIIYSGAPTALGTDAVSGLLYSIERDIRLYNTKDSSRNYGEALDIIETSAADRFSHQLRYLK